MIKEGIEVRKLALVMVVGLILGLIGVCLVGFAEEEQTAVWNCEPELLTPGVLTVATEGTYPPFSMVDEKGNLDGLEIRVVKEIARRLGLEYKPVMVKWESLLVGLFANQYDMISAAHDITSERQKKILFSDGWLESGGRLVVREDSLIETVDDIRGKVVGCLVASTWAELAKELGAADVRYYKAETDALQDLINRNIDGVVTEAIAIGYAIQQRNMPLKVVPGYLSRVQKGLVFNKNQTCLVGAMNQALAAMIADGTYAELTKDLIGFDPHPENPIRSNYYYLTEGE